MRPASLLLVASAAVVFKSVNVPAAPVVERQISKPLSFVELSVQVSPTAVVDVAVATRSVGVPGGGGACVVAQAGAVNSDGGALPVPTARTS